MALKGGGGQDRRLSWGGVRTFDSLQGVSHIIYIGTTVNQGCKVLEILFIKLDAWEIIYPLPN